MQNCITASSVWPDEISILLSVLVYVQGNISEIG